MEKHIMVGCDLHDKSMLLKIAVGREKPTVETWKTDGESVVLMVRHLTSWAARLGGARILFAYEACGFGFRLHDELSDAGIECYVLAPSKMRRSPKHRKRKTDERDAQLILDILKATRPARLPTGRVILHARGQVVCGRFCARRCGRVYAATSMNVMRMTQSYLAIPSTRRRPWSHGCGRWR
jgi:hypothetical protein